MGDSVPGINRPGFLARCFSSILESWFSLAMQFMCCRATYFCLLGLFILVFPLKSFPDVDTESVFREARIPASMLDVQLAIIQRTWWTTYVLNPDKAIKTKFPIITGVGMGIELEYANNDFIIARGIITRLNEFLKLTEDQKKLLIKNTLRNLRGHLTTAGTIVNKTSGMENGKLIENSHIKFSVIIEGLSENSKNESTGMALPHGAGIGQAGYANGYFVYSRPYYLKLRVINDKAVPGDKDSFEIEMEDKK